MKPLLESLLIPEEASWSYFFRRLEESIPFIWHHHVELELTLTVNSTGQRYVGDTIEPYVDDDLVLLGSKLPHTWMSQAKVDENAPHVAHVFWIKPEWLINLTKMLVELTPLQNLLAGANRGIVFSPATARKVREMTETMYAATPTVRLVRFVEVLSLLADDNNYRFLCPPGQDEPKAQAEICPRINRTLEYIHEHYDTDISIDELANMAALSPSGLHRLFKRHTRLTVSEYIAQLRIGKACALLISTEKPIACIADEVGYHNLSHFNRQFYTFKQLTPREFRSTYLKQYRPGANNFLFNEMLLPAGNGQQRQEARLA